MGDSAGFITKLDLRKIQNQRGRSIAANIGRFYGPAGSVRQIVKHERLPIIACVGLDRMLRTYDISIRKQLDCVYLKQRLNCMLFCSDDFLNSEEDESDADEKVDEEEVVEGDINDDDEVVDYIDSSNEEVSDDGESEEEASDFGDGKESNDASSDENFEEDDQIESDEEDAPKAKRRRK